MTRESLKKLASQEYVTRDGRYKVELNRDYETECDEPHPMRVRLDSLNSLSAWYRDKLIAQGTIRTNRRTGVQYLTYLCPGGESHWYDRWIVWDEASGDYAHGTGPDGFDTFGDARAFALASARQTPTTEGAS